MKASTSKQKDLQEILKNEDIQERSNKNELGRPHNQKTSMETPILTEKTPIKQIFHDMLFKPPNHKNKTNDQTRNKKDIQTSPLSNEAHVYEPLNDISPPRTHKLGAKTNPIKNIINIRNRTQNKQIKSQNRLENSEMNHITNTNSDTFNSDLKNKNKKMKRSKSAGINRLLDKIKYNKLAEVNDFAATDHPNHDQVTKQSPSGVLKRKKLFDFTKNRIASPFAYHIFKADTSKSESELVFKGSTNQNDTYHTSGHKLTDKANPKNDNTDQSDVNTAPIKDEISGIPISPELNEVKVVEIEQVHLNSVKENTVKSNNGSDNLVKDTSISKKTLKVDKILPFANEKKEDLIQPANKGCDTISLNQFSQTINDQILVSKSVPNNGANKIKTTNSFLESDSPEKCKFVSKSIRNGPNSNRVISSKVEFLGDYNDPGNGENNRTSETRNDRGSHYEILKPTTNVLNRADLRAPLSEDSNCNGINFEIHLPVTQSSKTGTEGIRSHSCFPMKRYRYAIVDKIVDDPLRDTNFYKLVLAGNFRDSNSVAPNSNCLPIEMERLLKARLEASLLDCKYISSVGDTNQKLRDNLVYHNSDTIPNASHHDPATNTKGIYQIRHSCIDQPITKYKSIGFRRRASTYHTNEEDVETLCRKR